MTNSRPVSWRAFVAHDVSRPARALATAIARGCLRAIGVLEVDEVAQVAAREVTDADARKAGFDDRAALACSTAER